jgi:hypothetical protein
VASTPSAQVSLSQDKIDRALTKRRSAAMAREDAEDLLRISRVRIRAIKLDQEQGVEHNRLPKPNFNIPSTPTSRPSAATGPAKAVTLHFAFTTIAKTVPPTSGGRIVFGSGYKGAALATAHSKYIERDGAPEIADQGSSQRQNVTSHAPSFERPLDGDSTLMGDAIDIADNAPLIFSNISPNAQIRQSYWTAVERCERSPRSQGINVNADVLTQHFDAIIGAPGIPRVLHDHLHHLHSAAQILADQGSKIQVKPLSNLTPDQAGEILSWQQRQPWYDENAAAFAYAPGRGGRIQYRIVAELPHEIDASARSAIVDKFVKELGDEGFMYTAVVHAPDAHNDARNYHLHLIMHDRPAQWRDDLGMWDFEYGVPSKRQHDGNAPIEYPFRQKKIARAADRSVPKGELRFIPSLRKRFVEISNEVLEREGVAKRYDHRSYADMGITKTPTVHLGPKASALEAQGVPTAPGVANAYATWTTIETTIEQAHMARVTKNNEHARTIGARIQNEIPAGKNQQTAKDLLAERTATQQNALTIQRELDLLLMLQDKAESRAKKTKAATDKIISDIEAGSSKEHYRLNTYRRRNREASEHLAKLADIFSQDEPLLAQMREAVMGYETKVAANDIAIQQLLKQTPAPPAPIIAPTTAPIGVNLPGLRVTPSASATAVNTKQPAAVPPTTIQPQVEAKKPMPQAGTPVVATDARQKKQPEPQPPQAAKPQRPITRPAINPAPAAGQQPPAKPIFEQPPVRSEADVARFTADWNNLIDQVAAGRHFLQPQPTSPFGFDAGTFSPEQRAMLANESVRERSYKRLKGVYDQQYLETQRLVKWFESVALKAARFPITPDGISTSQAPRAVQHLMRKYLTHPTIQLTLTTVAKFRADNPEALETSAHGGAPMPRPNQKPRDPMTAPASADKPPKPVSDNSIEARQAAIRQTEIARAERLYTHPSKATQPLVRELLTALRRADDDEKITPIVEKITSDPTSARECYTLGSMVYDAYLRVATATRDTEKTSTTISRGKTKQR